MDCCIADDVSRIELFDESQSGASAKGLISTRKFKHGSLAEVID